MTPSIVLLVATVLTVLVLVWLWRRGPAHRPAFFLAGMAIGLGFILVGIYQDDVEELVDGARRELVEAWEASQATAPPEVPEPDGWPRRSPRPRELPATFEPPEVFQPRGAFTRSPVPYSTRTVAADVSLVFPAGWDVRTPTRAGEPWLFPGPDEATPWQPVLTARGDDGSCVLLDASSYADELIFWEPMDAVVFELDGYSQEPEYYPLTYLSRQFAGPAHDSVDGYLIETQTGPAGAIDVSLTDGTHQRHYLLNDEERWFYLMCSSEAPPPDFWRSVAESLDWYPGLPLAAPTPSPTPSPTLTPAEVELHGLVPYSDCDGRDPAADQAAVVSCETGDGIKVTYTAFRSIDELREWWVRQFRSVPSMPGSAAIERCGANEPAQSGWYLDRAGRPGGRYVCRPARSVILPSFTWTDEALLLVGRATSGDLGVPELYQRWEQGDFTPVR